MEAALGAPGLILVFERPLPGEVQTWIARQLQLLADKQQAQLASGDVAEALRKMQATPLEPQLELGATRLRELLDRHEGNRDRLRNALQRIHGIRSEPRVAFLEDAKPAEEPPEEVPEELPEEPPPHAKPAEEPPEEVPEELPEEP